MPIVKLQYKMTEKYYRCEQCGTEVESDFFSADTNLCQECINTNAIKEDIKIKDEIPKTKIVLSTGKPPRKSIKILLWFISFVIAIFYILSSLGWFIGSYMLFTQKSATNIPESFLKLSILDHIIRILQVLIVLAACVSLLFWRRIAKKLFSICIAMGVICFLFVGKWAITFISFPYSTLLLIIIYVYVYLLERRGLLY